MIYDDLPTQSADVPKLRWIIRGYVSIWFHNFPIVGSQMPMMLSNTSELHTSKIQEETAEKSDQFL